MDTTGQFGLAMVVVGLMGVLDRVFAAYPEFRETYERDGLWAARNALYERAIKEARCERALNKRNANLRYYKAVECEKYYEEAEAYGRVASDLSYAFTVADMMHYRDGITTIHRGEWRDGWCEEWSVRPLGGGHWVSFRRDRDGITTFLGVYCTPKQVELVAPQSSPAVVSDPVDSPFLQGLLSAPAWRLHGGYDTQTTAIPRKVRVVGGTRRRRNARRRVNR